jgi:hypothetical protein
MPAPLPPPLEINEFVVSVESATPITPSPNNNNDSPAGNSTNLLTEDEDEDDFDFKDRPPSSIICKPMEPKEEDVAFEFEDEDPVINDDVLSGWSKPSDLGGKN